jgi:hypothetical protein
VAGLQYSTIGYGIDPIPYFNGYVFITVEAYEIYCQIHTAFSPPFEIIRTAVNAMIKEEK